MTLWEVREKIKDSRLTALTAGGRREADIATPTNEPKLPPKKERATAAPEGIATSKPTTNPRGWPLHQKNRYF